MNEPKFCCEEFSKNSNRFDSNNDGTWNINGCCGGGCFVVTGIKFCPYCGEKFAMGDK